MHITVWNLKTHDPVKDYDLDKAEDVERLVNDLNDTVSGVVFEVSELGERIPEKEQG